MVMLIIFIAGYFAIAFEHSIGLNKAASALITGVLCWMVYAFSPSVSRADEELMKHVGNISGILFFLLGAMTIVELIDAHDGFDVITSRITTRNKKKLLWLISLLSFLLSAVLDNLTTAIVMVSLVRKIVYEKEDRLMYCGIIVIAANAGGAWSPIGDVTTTMLWIGGQISTDQIILHIFFPSLLCLLAPLLLISFQMKGALEIAPGSANGREHCLTPVRHRNIVFFSGILVLLLVPVFKVLTHLPPFMGMLLGLGIMWIITEILYSGKDKEDKHFLSVLYALRKIDASSILFFLGILLGVAALESAGHLHRMAEALEQHVKSETALVSIIGFLSSVVDNVPLVAAAMGMFGLDQYPANDAFWLFLAYCAGTGGSILIIGSAAGVAAMGLEKISFFWYVRKISWLALIGYVSGIAMFLLQEKIF